MGTTTQRLSQAGMPTDRTTCYAMVPGPHLRSVRPLATPRYVAPQRTEDSVRGQTRIGIVLPGSVFLPAPSLPRPHAVSPQCGSCTADLDLPRTCDACKRGNLAAHSFCGWCGTALPPTAAELVRAQQATLITANGEPVTNVSAALPRDEAEPTRPGNGEGSTAPGPARDATSPGTRGRTAVDGLAVVLLGTPADGSHARGDASYHLDLLEPFDVSGADVDRPASFTATPEGLRFDQCGDLDGVFVRVPTHARPASDRDLRVERELGTFQAVRPGETLPVGALAIIGTALVRVDAA